MRWLFNRLLWEIMVYNLYLPFQKFEPRATKEDYRRYAQARREILADMKKRGVSFR